MKTFHKLTVILFLKETFLIFISSLFLLHNAQAHWTSKGPYGGSISCFAVVDTILYSGTTNGGIYWGKNSNTPSWGYVNYNGLTSGHITAINSIGSHETGYKVIAGTSDKGIFVSDTKGLSWKSSNNGLSNLHVTSLARYDEYLFAGTSGGGIYISADSAKSWQASPSNSLFLNTDITSLAIIDNVLFACTSTNGIFYTTDNGTTWIALNQGLNDPHVNSISNIGSEVYAATPSGVFYLNQRTFSWETFNDGLTNTGINHLFTSGEILYAATNHGVYSFTEGNSWNAINTGYTDTVTSVIVHNNILYAGTRNDGIYRSTSLSSVKWQAFNTGLNNIETYMVYNNGNLVITATAKGVFVSHDLMANMYRANKGLTDSLHVNSICFAGSELFAATKYGGVFSSQDTGKTWIERNSGLANLSVNYIYANATTLYVATSGGNVYSSPLNTINWVLSENLPSNLVVTALTGFGSVVYIGSSQGVFSSNDNQHWSEINTGLSNTYITSLAVNNTFLFAGTMGSGVFRTLLNDNSWTAVNSGLPDLSITVLYATGQYIVAGYKGGVQVSTSSGYQWLPPNVLLYIPNYADITGISFTMTGSTPSTRIFVATPFNVIYSNSINELPVTAQDPSLSIFHAVKTNDYIQLYPNPSNGTFTINLSGLKENVKTISIYNHSGKKMDTFSGNVSEFNLNYTPGMYLIQVQTLNNDILTQKLLIQ